MRRRNFIALVGGTAAAWPLATHAQQPKMPVVGFLGSSTSRGYEHPMAAVLESMRKANFVDGRNIKIEYRWANDQYVRLPELAAELVRLRVDVIVTTGGIVSAQAAKRATTTIPIVILTGADPVKNGVVASLNRPGGNVTGVTYFTNLLAPKRLELLREVVPNVSVVAMLINPHNPATESDTKDMEVAAQTTGVKMTFVRAVNEHDIDLAIASAVEQRADAIVIHPDALFTGRASQIIALVARHALPAMYVSRRHVETGGFISYGPEFSDLYRQAGSYIGRILKGEKPADLPVVQPTKFELVLNRKTAKALGLAIPDKLMALANEVIE